MLSPDCGLRERQRDRKAQPNSQKDTVCDLSSVTTSPWLLQESVHSLDIVEVGMELDTASHHTKLVVGSCSISMLSAVAIPRLRRFDRLMMLCPAAAPLLMPANHGDTI